MILVLSGTSDGREIVAALLAHGYDVMATTVTSYGRDLLAQQTEGTAHDATSSGGGLVVRTGALQAEDLRGLIGAHRIRLLIDATHPFAVNVSRMAMEVCRDLPVPYIRYERAGTRLESSAEGLLFAGGFDEAAQLAARCLAEREGTAFLTVGSNHLEKFCAVIPPKRLIARVLPQAKVLQRCEALGLTAANIVALHGPFSRELNRELYKQYRAAVVVTKDSGETGGTEEKIDAARDLGLPVILVQRPELPYPSVARTVQQVLELAKKQFPPEDANGPQEEPFSGK